MSERERVVESEREREVERAGESPLVLKRHLVVCEALSGTDPSLFFFEKLFLDLKKMTQI
jgi:hypothetical protein